MSTGYPNCDSRIGTLCRPATILSLDIAVLVTPTDCFNCQASCGLRAWESINPVTLRLATQNFERIEVVDVLMLQAMYESLIQQKVSLPLSYATTGVGTELEKLIQGLQIFPRVTSDCGCLGLKMLMNLMGPVKCHQAKKHLASILTSRLTWRKPFQQLLYPLAWLALTLSIHLTQRTSQQVEHRSAS